MLIRVYDCLSQCHHVQRICQTAFYPWSLMHVNHIHWCHQQTSSHAGLPSPPSLLLLFQLFGCGHAGLVGWRLIQWYLYKKVSKQNHSKFQLWTLYVLRVFNIFWLQEHHPLFFSIQGPRASPCATRNVGFSAPPTAIARSPDLRRRHCWDSPTAPERCGNGWMAWANM